MCKKACQSNVQDRNCASQLIRTSCTSFFSVCQMHYYVKKATLKFKYQLLKRWDKWQDSKVKRVIPEGAEEGKVEALPPTSN